MQVAERGDIRKRAPQLFGVIAIGVNIRAADRDLDWRQRAQTHHPANDVARLKGNPDIRHIAGEFPPEPLLQIFNANARPTFELYLQDSFF